jgi:hypothetical protein
VSAARQHRLRGRARYAAERRGHVLTHFAYDSARKLSASAQCVLCHAWVQVNVRPAANEIDVGGTAVALNCKAVDKIGGESNAQTDCI